MGMREEMAEQPAVLRRFIEDRYDEVEAVARALCDRPVSFGYLVARGSSDNAALYAKYLFGIANGLPTASAAPSLWTLYDAGPGIKDALVIGISQSGASTDLVRVMEDARRQGAATVAVTNTTDSPMAHAAEFVIDIGAGPELAVAATKTYTATLMALAALSASMAGDTSAREKLSLVPNLVEEALDLDESAAATAEALRDATRCCVIGRGFNFSTAHEWSLKLKELAHIVAEPYSSADFRHGPIALVEKGFPVLAVNVEGRARDDVSDLLERLQNEREGSLYCAGDVQADLDRSDIAMPLGSSSEAASPIAAVIPGQLLAWNLARVRGLDPDSPRGLAKVTRTE